MNDPLIFKEEYHLAQDLEEQGRYKEAYAKYSNVVKSIALILNSNEPMEDTSLLHSLLAFSSERLNLLYPMLNESKPNVPPKPIHLRSPKSEGFDVDSRDTLDSLELDLDIQENGCHSTIPDTASDVSSILESVLLDSQSNFSEKGSTDTFPLPSYTLQGDDQLIQSALQERNLNTLEGNNEPIIMNDLGLHSVISSDVGPTVITRKVEIETKSSPPPSIPISPLVSLYTQLLKSATPNNIELPPTEAKPTLSESNPLTRALYYIHLSSTIMKFNYLQPQSIAYQLCLIEQDLFLKILPQDFLMHRPPKYPSLSILSSTHFFNYLTRIIEYSILEYSNAHERCVVLQGWIKVAKKLYDLRNFQTLKAVLSALSTPPIIRLKQTWSILAKKRLNEFKTLTQFLSEVNNYAIYRKWMKHNIHRPMIPYLGIYLHDMTYLLALENKKNSSQKTLNKMIQDIFNQIRYFQAEKYSRMRMESPSTSMLHAFRHKKGLITLDAPVELQELNSMDEQTQSQFIQHWLLAQKWYSEKEIDQLSLERESTNDLMNSKFIETPETPKKSKSLFESIKYNTKKVISRSNSNTNRKNKDAKSSSAPSQPPTIESSKLASSANSISEPF